MTGIEAYLRRAPKVELHVHLEGALRPERLLRILRRHGTHREYQRPEDLAWLYQHDDLAAFLDHFRFAVTQLQDVQDVHDVAHDLFESLASQNVVYAEVLFSAAIFVRQGMAWEELLAAVEEAARAVALEIKIVVDLVRNFGPEFAEQQVETLARLGRESVVGIHLGGDEPGFPASLFTRAYQLAHEARLGLAAHAGEGVGADSVQQALALGVQRIGHGIRCLESESVVEQLLERGTLLEVCPTSNVQTRVVPGLRTHPLSELLRRGIRVALGSDDPSFFGTDITREMQIAHDVLDLHLATLDRMIDDAMQAAFLPEAVRRERLEAMRRERAGLRGELGL
ncbi:MAG: adenosine deaminase [Candidatus Latescibacterota bacterium]|nr:MAG: adenosine deaminase [Candidatus Latescibacterota bacterium]